MKQIFAEYKVDNPWWNLNSHANPSRANPAASQRATGLRRQARNPPASTNRTGNPFATPGPQSSPFAQKMDQPTPNPLQEPEPELSAGEANLVAHDFLLAMVRQGLVDHAQEYRYESRRLVADIKRREASIISHTEEERKPVPRPKTAGNMRGLGIEARLEALLRKKNELVAELEAMKKTAAESGKQDHLDTVQNLNSEVQHAENLISACESELLSDAKEPDIMPLPKSEFPKALVSSQELKNLEARLKFVKQVETSLQKRISEIGAERQTLSHSLGPRFDHLPTYKPGMLTPKLIANVPAVSVNLLPNLILLANLALRFLRRSFSMSAVRWPCLAVASCT
jgi:hypothetical protein